MPQVQVLSPRPNKNSHCKAVLKQFNANFILYCVVNIYFKPIYPNQNYNSLMLNRPFASDCTGYCKFIQVLWLYCKRWNKLG